MRSKVITLFNKNHIQITKEIRPSISCVPELKYISGGTGYGRSFNYKKTWKREPEKEITLESPLGFYYKKKVRKEAADYVAQAYLSMGSLVLILPDLVYTLSYPVNYGSTGLGYETRPWEIVPGDKSFSDHFIEDLKREVDRIFEMAEENKVEIGDRKRKVYKDLFGFPEGPKHMTDQEKILSHGFDLKESFRKRKE